MIDWLTNIGHNATEICGLVPFFQAIIAILCWEKLPKARIHRQGPGALVISYMNLVLDQSEARSRWYRWMFLWKQLNAVIRKSWYNTFSFQTGILILSIMDICLCFTLHINKIEVSVFSTGQSLLWFKFDFDWDARLSRVVWAEDFEFWLTNVSWVLISSINLGLAENLTRSLVIVKFNSAVSLSLFAKPEMSMRSVRSKNIPTIWLSKATSFLKQSRSVKQSVQTWRSPSKEKT